MAEQEKVIVKLQGSDGEKYEMEELTAAKFLFVDGVVRSHEVRDGAMMIPQVSGKTLFKVVAYCKKHSEDVNQVVLKAWDDNFINVDDDILCNLIAATQTLGITSLMGLCARKFAEIIKEHTIDEIRTKFNIQKDFTPEEEEAIRREKQWEI